MNKVSILIPVYNVKNYLRDCLDSILDQTYIEYEVICVDDGSTDGSEIILDLYSDKYDQIKVFHKSNTGYGNTMNIALEKASGQYIAIVEPDDFVESNWLMEVMRTFDKYEDLDILKSDYFEYSDGSKTKINILDNKKNYNKLLEGEDRYTLLLANHIAHWSAIYKKNFLKENNIIFNETVGASYQDLGFWFQTIIAAKKILLINYAFYNYRNDNPESSMNCSDKVNCTRQEYDFVWQRICMRNDLKKLIPYYTRCRVSSYIDTYKRISQCHRENYLDIVHEDLNELIFDERMLDEEELEIFYLLKDKVEEVHKRKKIALQAVRSSLSDYQEVYIYGAGNIAKFIYKLLDEEEKNKIKAFLVSKKTNETYIDKIPIKEFSTEIDLKNLFIIGVSKRFYKEVEENLKSKGVTNIFGFREYIGD